MKTRLVLLSAVLISCAGIRAGDLETKSLDSKLLGKEVKINVLLPEAYAAEKDRRFPVVYLLHGYGGDFSEWQRVGVVEEAKGLPVILAMPEGDQSFYINHHDDPHNRWEDYVTQEVVKFVDDNYRTFARAESRAISGLSMGGYGAMVLGLRHPDMFRSIASHSGALGVPGGIRQGEIGERLKMIFGPEGSKARELYSLVGLIGGLAKEARPAIYIDCGSSDFLLQSNRDFVAELAKLKVSYEYREVPGGHDFAYWKRNVRYSLLHQLKALEDAAKQPVVVKAPASTQPKPAGAKIAGEWEMSIDYGGETRDYTLRITEKDGKLAAMVISPRSGEHPAQSVEFKEGVLQLKVPREFEGNAATMVYEGKLEGGKLSGKIKVAEFGDFEATWTAKPKAQPEKL